MELTEEKTMNEPEVMESKEIYAIIETGGKQYIVEPGSKIKVEKLEGEKGQEIILDRVLLVKDNGKILTGEPYLENFIVKAKILKQGKGKKIIVYKFKRRKKYRRKKGHRQLFTELLIQEISPKQ